MISFSSHCAGSKGGQQPVELTGSLTVWGVCSIILFSKFNQADMRINIVAEKLGFCKKFRLLTLVSPSLFMKRGSGGEVLS